MAQLSPPALASASLSLVEITLTDQSAGVAASGKGWLVSLAHGSTPSDQQPDTQKAVAVRSFRPGRVTLRTQLRAETPGVHSLVICTQEPCVVHAITPLLVAPNASVQNEMSAVFSMMKAVVQQQLQMGGQVAAADLEAAASEATWAQHFQLLLWDIQAVLHTTSAQPDCLPAPVAAGVLAGVMEFLGHHGCWCSISWLLAQAINAKLLQHAKAAAAVRLQESQPFTAGALCGGFVLGLAASPSPVRKPVAGGSSSSSSPEGTISRSRRVLSALSATVCGLQRPTTTTSTSSYCTAASGAPAALYRSSSSGSPALHSSQPLQVLANDCSSSKGSCGSSCGGISRISRNAERPTTAAAARAAAAALNALLGVMAACLLLLVVRGQQGTEAQEGCAVVFEPDVLPDVLGPPVVRVGTVLAYTPLIALLVFALSLASRVCLVL